MNKQRCDLSVLCGISHIIARNDGNYRKKNTKPDYTAAFFRILNMCSRLRFKKTIAK